MATDHHRTEGGGGTKGTMEAMMTMSSSSAKMLPKSRTQETGRNG